MHHRPIVFVDVETTGLSARDGHVVEVGAVRVEKGAVVATFNRLVDPGVDLPHFITKITGIKTSDIKGQPQFAHIIDDFDQFLSGAIFAAHNVDFDYSFIGEEYRRNGRVLHIDRFCTAKLSRKLHPQHRRHSLDALISRGNYMVKARHRAYDDAHVLYQFFAEQYAVLGPELFNYIEKLLITARQPKQPPSISIVPFFD